MRQRAKRLMVLAMGMQAMSGCGSGDVTIWMHVKNVTADLATLQVSLTLDGKPATQQYEFTQGLGDVAIKLRSDQLGQGKLRVSLNGLTADRCVISSGSYETSVTSSTGVSETDVALSPLVPTQCTNFRPNLVKVPKGSFTMGSPTTEAGRGTDETQHQITLTTDFWIAESEVTQLQYQNLMGTSPSKFRGDELPVERLTWNDAVAYCNALSLKEKLTPCYQISGSNVGWANGYKCTGYRLPTEAEWEYAANPPSPPRTVYAGSDAVDGVAWYSVNAANLTHPVKTKAANGRSLYDLSGNVSEWVWDIYQSNYEALPPTDPLGAASGTLRVIRGGGCLNNASGVRVAVRSAASSGGAGGTSNGCGVVTGGFRIARSIL